MKQGVCLECGSDDKKTGGIIETLCKKFFSRCVWCGGVFHFKGRPFIANTRYGVEKKALDNGWFFVAGDYPVCPSCSWCIVADYVDKKNSEGVASNERGNTRA